MIVIPAIDLKDGKCVQLVGGVFGSEQVVIDDAHKVVKQFYEAGIKRLHIIDLNAAKKKGDNESIVISLLSQKKCPVEVGGGIRSIIKAKKLITAGADYVIVGTAALQNKKFLEVLSKKIGKDKIIVSLDYKNKKVVTQGWDVSLDKSPIEIGKEIQEYCGAILATCVNMEGQLRGPDTEYLAEIIRELSVPIIASGGISSLKDLQALKEINVFGAVIGMALYKGKIHLKDAILF